MVRTILMLEKNILQGIWKPRKIENPDFFEDMEPFKMTPIVSMKNEVLYCCSSTDNRKSIYQCFSAVT